MSFIYSLLFLTKSQVNLTSCPGYSTFWTHEYQTPRESRYRPPPPPDPGPGGHEHLRAAATGLRLLHQARPSPGPPAGGPGAAPHPAGDLGHVVPVRVPGAGRRAAAPGAPHLPVHRRRRHCLPVPDLRLPGGLRGLPPHPAMVGVRGHRHRVGRHELRALVPLQVKNRIHVLRAEMRETQAELAERLNVSRQTINALETEKYDPSLQLAFGIAKLFGKPMEEIFLFEADGAPSNH